MGLRQQAAADLASILEDAATGFGWPITVTDPNGFKADLVGFSTDIGHTIDPQTGMAVTGRQASIALRIGALADQGLGIPIATQDGSRKPWVIEFDDINGTSFTFAVTQSAPDRALGIVTCILEPYER